MPLNPGSPIRLLPTTFHRVPFNRLKRLRGKVGSVRRVIGREYILSEVEGPGRVLLEVEVGGVIGVCWDFEVKVVDGVSISPLLHR